MLEKWRIALPLLSRDSGSEGFYGSYVEFLSGLRYSQPEMLPQSSLFSILDQLSVGGPGSEDEAQLRVP